MTRYSSKKINRDFRIKLYGRIDGKRVNKLLGVTGAIDLLGEDLLYRLLDRAYKKGTIVEVCKLRRGIKITLYSR